MSITGNILRVNLSTKTTALERPGENFYRQYFGGRGLIIHYLLKELALGIDPLGPENKLIFAGGPLTGAPLPGTGRSSVGAKSPLTGAYGDSEAGGFWGAELNKAGFDAVIIEGKSDSPVYLWIKNGQAEIRDAGHIWGKKTAAAQDMIKEELGDNKIRIAQIGIAGENLVRYANIAHDLTHFAGRTGMGAVMGSKNLKAVAVRGTQKTALADPETVKELAQWMGQNVNKVSHLHDLGTACFVTMLNELGALPTRNFTSGTFDGAQQISGETIRDTIYVKSESCYSCPVRCKRVVKVLEPYNVDPVYGGPEYESIASLGSLLGIDNLAAVAKGNELCNSYGLDTISTGVSIAFAMECYEKGILTGEDTGGIELKFGNAEAMLEMIEQIAHRRDFGKILSEGVKRASEIIGRNSAEFAMHIKGQEIPMHEPRLKQGLGVGYMVSPTGADHCHNIHDTYFNVTADMIKPLGLLNPIPLQNIGEEKMRLLAYFGNWIHLGNCTLCCMFVPWSYRQVVQMVEAVTGWTTSLWELLKVGERAATLCRVFNIREGFTKNDDMIKSRWFEHSFAEGPLKGVKFSKEELEQARANYYRIMGWDEDGVPTQGKLMDLGIGWAEKYIGWRRG
ncbi:aldehyde ferredoxin oxidoreductase family protein [Desulfoscipio geothermicus]|uniref:Aldehyde:ferredoxin oxidoreductase n=1 Tax=Desulfoscipio geothermicus DSM 3669 TaxID=1121426 RepID=A0A1I6D5T8_9FIRM|nr:aldehyde ferredoxin oxidoreductase family protein [Desulfoscipio geothermicus]SFR00834.1 aldehyde:ferredoxin oxidoreductase [Desulfoscipio geothermicus DSM 3669]